VERAWSARTRDGVPRYHDPARPVSTLPDRGREPDRQERQQHVAKRVVLHIGTMKSGTSFVQSALMANPAVLDAAGARYLGETFGRQTKAVRDVYQSPRRPARHGRWHALVDEAHEFGGSVGIISMEFLSFAEESQLGVLLDPFAGMEVEVVLTVRDQFRAIPAQWQTFTRNFGTDAWETYLRRIDASSLTPRALSRAARSFRRSQDARRILDRWSADPRVARVTVVTVPPPDAPREELWRRFCRAVRMSAENARLDQTKDNASLGYASCDFLRRLNVHIGDVKPRFYRKGTRPLAREALAPLRDSEGRPELDRRGAELARDLNRRIRESVAAAGYDLVGSLDDLPIPDQVVVPERISPPPTGDVRRAALVAREHVSEHLEVPPGPAPDDLDDLVAEVARLMRKAHGWGL
jgi:hypothetical protein